MLLITLKIEEHLTKVHRLVFITPFLTPISQQENSTTSGTIPFGQRYIWERISFEDQLPPSVEGLEWHWLRTIWVVDCWSQASQSTVTLLPLDCFGWKVNGNKVSVEWDSPDNIQQVRNRVAFLTHRSGCKTGCATARCKCVKAGHQWGAGCGCNHHSECKNRNSFTSEGKSLDSSDSVHAHLMYILTFIPSDIIVPVEEEESEESESETGGLQYS